MILLAVAALTRADPEPGARRGGGAARRAKVSQKFSEPEVKVPGPNATESKNGENREGKCEWN